MMMPPARPEYSGEQGTDAVFTPHIPLGPFGSKAWSDSIKSHVRHRLETRNVRVLSTTVDTAEVIPLEDELCIWAQDDCDDASVDFIGPTAAGAFKRNVVIPFTVARSVNIESCELQLRTQPFGELADSGSVFVSIYSATNAAFTPAASRTLLGVLGSIHNHQLSYLYWSLVYFRTINPIALTAGVNYFLVISADDPSGVAPDPWVGTTHSVYVQLRHMTRGGMATYYYDNTKEYPDLITAYNARAVHDIWFRLYEQTYSLEEVPLTDPTNAPDIGAMAVMRRREGVHGDNELIGGRAGEGGNIRTASSSPGGGGGSGFDPIMLALFKSYCWTGFEDRTSSALSFVDATRIFTITGIALPVWYDGVRYLQNTDTVMLGDTTGLHYIYYDATMNLVESTIWPGFNVPLVASVYYNTIAGMDKGLVTDERHGYLRPTNHWHERTHLGEGVTWASGLGVTFPSDITFAVALGVIWDEDVKHSIALQTTGKVLYLDGAADWKWDGPQTTPYKLNGATLRYNNGTALADVTNNYYVAYWVFATPGVTSPIWIVMGQRQDQKLLDARANNNYDSLVLGALPSPEMKLLGRVIFQNNGGAADFVEWLPLYRFNNLPSSGGTPSDTGLYLLLAGRPGGQVAYGGTAAGDDLELVSTAHGTKGNIYFGTAKTTTYDEVNERFGIATAIPLYPLHVTGQSYSTTQ